MKCLNALYQWLSGLFFYKFDGMRKTLFIAISTALLSSCATISLKTDYDPGAAFDDYRTYRVNPDMQSGMSELDQRRLVRLIDSVMQARGFERKLIPDLIVDVRSQIYRRESQPSFGFGMGGTNANVSGGMSVGIPAGGSSLRRQIDIAFFEFTTDKIVWEARTETGFKEKITPGEREEALRKVVVKALDAYPPQK